PAARDRAPASRVVGAIWWTVRFLGALFLFVGALQLMKTGAASLDILQEGGFLVKNSGATLGLGWIGALFVLSGSPVAATALTLVAAESITEIEGFTMLTGSRLGAAFVVLVVAVIYALRGGAGERLKPVSTAIMALSTTAVIYVPAAVLGLALLRWSPYSSLDLQFPARFGDLLEFVYGGLLSRVETLPAVIVFLGGLGVLLLSFKLIDGVMPTLDEQTLGDRRMQWLRQKWSMFALGCLVALVTMSVSVALAVLVPLVAKRYAKREDIIPYIMGANITTLGDTFIAALALHSPAAVRIVLAGVISTSVLSVIVLAFFYPQLRTLIFRFQRQMLKSKPRLAAFTAGLFVVPLVTIALSNLAA
ncbi:MAG: hypothetical protein M3238_00600, partial [Actinomycetota bacterium]|nr:hypothetical protein [Actinomycetota bacterium]